MNPGGTCQSPDRAHQCGLYQPDPGASTQYEEKATVICSVPGEEHA